MEWIVFGSRYQAKEGLYFYAHFFIEELSIYVARQSGVAFPLYKQTPRATIRVRFTKLSEARSPSEVSTRLNPTSRGRIRLSINDKAPASPIRSLDFVCAKALQTLATVSLTVHVVRSTKKRLSLSPYVRSTLRDQAANTDFDHDAPAIQYPDHVRLAVRTALALQHLAHVQLAVRASNHIDTPRLTQHIVKTGTSIYQPRPTSATHNDHPAAPIYPQQSSSCTSTTRPTSATRNDRPAASLRLDHTSYRDHPSSWRHKYNYHELYKRTCKYDNKLSSLLYL